MDTVPHMAHLKATSSVGAPVADHRAPLTMKDTAPQLWQVCPFCAITRRRHPGRSPEGYMPEG